MTKTIIALVTASFSGLVSADELTIFCATKDLSAKPYVTFELKVKSSANKPVLAAPKSVEIFASSLPFYGAETVVGAPELIDHVVQVQVGRRCVHFDADAFGTLVGIAAGQLQQLRDGFVRHGAAAPGAAGDARVAR